MHDSTASPGLLAQLQATLSKMEFALASVDEAIVWTDLQGRIEWCNVQFENLVDRPSDVLLNQALAGLLPLTQQGKLLALADHPVNRAVASSSSRACYEFCPGRSKPEDGCLHLEITWSHAPAIRADRPTILFVIRVTPQARTLEETHLDLGQQVQKRTAELACANQSLLTEIKERQKVEEALRRSEEQLRLAQTLTQVSSWDWNPLTGELCCSESAAQMLGLSQEEIGSITYSLWHDRIHPKDLDRVEGSVLHALSTQTGYEAEYRVIHPNGSIHWLLSRGQGIYNEAGQAVRMVGIAIDISDRKRDEAIRKLAEDAVRESQQQIATIIANIPGGVYRFVYHADGSVSFPYASQGYRDLLGLEPESMMDYPQRLREMIHPEDREQMRIAVEAAKETLEPVQLEHRMILASGEVRWLASTARFSKEATGDYVVDGVVVDVSDRKQAEIRVEQQQEFLRTVIDTNPNLIFVKDWEGHYLLANQALANYHNTTVEELTDKQITDFLPAPIANAYTRQNQQVISTQRGLFIPEEEATHPLHRGTWLQWQKQPIYLPNSGTYGVLGVGVNITERKRAESSLKSILQGTASVTGKDFFPVLVQNLVSALGVRHAIVTEWVGDRLSPLAFHLQDQIQPALSEALTTNPCCRIALERYLYCCPMQVQQLFPETEVLAALQAESYLGVAMLDGTGQAIGNLCIIDNKPLTDIARAEAVLRIFAARAAAELERQRATTALQQLNQELEVRVERRTQELTQSQADLQQQTHLLRAILDSSGDGLVVCDRTGKYLVFNLAAQRILGLELLETSFLEQMEKYEIYLPDRVTPCPLEQLPMIRAIQGEVADDVEVFIRHAGKPEGVLLDITIGPFKDETGQILGGVAAFRDSTEKKQIEEALRRREQEFRTLVENSPDLIMRFDRNIRYIYGNPRLEWETQIPISDYVGKQPSDLNLPSEVTSIWEAAICQTFETGAEQTLEYELDLPIGPQVCIARCVPEYAIDGSITSVLMVSRHITALKQAEAAFRASEEQFRRIFEDAPIAIAIVNIENHQILRVNAAHRQMFSYSDAELSRMTFDDLTHPEDIAADVQQFNQMVEGKIPSFQMEKRYIKKNGEVIWTNLTATLLRDQNGCPLYEMGMIADITTRKQAEERLRASLQEKEILLKEVHHRVKNNLQTVQSLLSLQARSIAEPKIVEAITESQKRVKAMAMVHEKLYQSDRLEKINFADYVRSLTQELLQSCVINRTAIKLQVEVSPIELPIEVALPCGLIINELFSNAMKHAFPGDQAGQISIQFGLNSADQYVLTVADNGIGVPESVDGNTNSLGMRLVKALTRQLRGVLELECTNGSLFKIAFAKQTRE